ncbi:MAG: AAA family ATPase [Patescibacteria group bacterium]
MSFPRIKSVSIKNFRSFSNDDFEVVKFPEVDLPISIVGYNNSGKTHFIHAILRACGMQTKYKESFDEEDFYFQNTGDKAEIKIEFSQSFKVSTIYQVDKECHGAHLEIKEDENGTINGFAHAVDAEGKTIIKQERIKGRGLPVLMSSLKDKLNVIYIDFRELEKHLLNKSYSLLGKRLKDIKEDFYRSDNLVKNRKNEDIPRKEYFEQIINFIESNLIKTEAFISLVSEWETSIKEQLEIENDSLKISFQIPKADEIYDSIAFKLSDHATKPAVSIEKLGEGFKSMLIIAILRSLAELNNGGRIIIFEEPETFLHEHFQEYFYKVLCKLAENNQIIYTTHSKKFVDVFNPQSIVKIVNPDYLKSSIIQPPQESFILDVPKKLDEFELKNPEDFAKYLKTLEPNIGNILFASRVIIVEGPHDILAYKTIFENQVNFALKNIAIVAAWGKDSIPTIIVLCKLFKTDCFVIHDWDLDNDNDPNTLPEGATEEEKKKQVADKQQWTKNKNILDKIENENSRHCNKRNLEKVLDIERNQKGTVAIYQKLKDKSLEYVQKQYPKLVSDNLLNFLGIQK